MPPFWEEFIQSPRLKNISWYDMSTCKHIATCEEKKTRTVDQTSATYVSEEQRHRSTPQSTWTKNHEAVLYLQEMWVHLSSGFLDQVGWFANVLTYSLARAWSFRNRTKYSRRHPLFALKDSSHSHFLSQCMLFKVNHNFSGRRKNSSNERP